MRLSRSKHSFYRHPSSSYLRILPFVACSNLALFISGYAVAGEGVVNPGSTLTSGATSASNSVYAGVFNPAVGSLMIAPKESFRMGYLPSFGTDAEVGQVDNFIDDLNDLVDIIDDPTSSNDPVQTLLDRFNAALIKMGDEGYVKNSVSIHAPIMPLYWQPSFLDGVFMLDASVNTQLKASILDAPLEFHSESTSFTTATSLYLKGAIEKSLALGYSQALLDKPLAKEYGGQLFAGAKLSVYNIDLSKQTFLLEKLDGKDVDKVIKDEYDRNLVSTTNVGLDLGLAWVADNYRVGASLLNINQPSFDYGAIGTNCQTRKEGSVERSNCESAATFAKERGDIKTLESHVKAARVVVDGEYQILSGWTVGGSADLAAFDDLVGSQNQWVNLSTQYVPSIHWVPAVRVGYQSNLVGSQLSAVTAGLTFWGILTLDAKMALDKVTVDGNSAPRSAGFSISIAEAF